MKRFKFIFLILPLFALAQVGIGIENPSESFQPTEDLHIKGTLRINDLPQDGATGAIYTQSNGVASNSKDQTFSPTKTLVVDDNGVMGVVNYLPDTRVEDVKTIKYAFNSVPINSSTPTASETTLGNLTIKLETQNANIGDKSLYFKIINNITEGDGTPATVDRVIVNQLKFERDGSRNGGARKVDATKDEWYEITPQGPSIRNDEHVIFHIALLRTRDMYRVSAFVTDEDTPQVTIFIERLTD